MGVGPERPEEAMAVGEEATGFIPPPIDENKACFSPTILWRSLEFPGRLVESFVHTFFREVSGQEFVLKRRALEKGFPLKFLLCRYFG